MIKTVETRNLYGNTECVKKVVHIKKRYLLGIRFHTYNYTETFIEDEETVDSKKTIGFTSSTGKPLKIQKEK